MNHNSHFWGGLFYNTFWFEASLYMFLIFWNFGGSFLSLVFSFWKFRNCILNQNSQNWWGLFYKTFWFEASLYMFLIFWNFGGSFLSLIFSFWKFWNYILNHNFHFWGVCFKNFLIWGLIIYVFDNLGIFGVFFELDFWFLKILKLYSETDHLLLGGLFS